MSTTRAPGGTSLGPGLRLAATAAATTWAAMLSWSGFTELAAQFLFALIGVGIVVAGLGALGRWRHLPGAATFLAQALGGTVIVCLFVSDRPYPDASFWTALDDAFTAAQTYPSPVPTDGDVSVQPLLVIGGLAAMLLVDLLACTLRRVPLAGLPLLAVYSVPVSMLDGGLRWWVFALTALGFLMMLFLQEQEHVGRWGRLPRRRGLGPARRSDAGAARARCGWRWWPPPPPSWLPWRCPTFELQVFDLGSGPGGNNDITIETPSPTCVATCAAARTSPSCRS